MVANPPKRTSTAIRTPRPDTLPEYIDQLFESMRQELIAGIFPATSLWEGGFTNGLVLAPTDIEDRPNAYVVRANIPGVKKENIELRVQGHQLRIEAKESSETEEKGKNYLRHERTYAGFARTFELPEDVVADKISAHYDDGVLTVEVPKVHPEPAKKIPVA